MASIVSDAAAKRKGMCPLNDDLWVISFLGKDRPGLIRDILEEPAQQNVNIVDMDQRVMQGIFVMSVVADFANARVTASELQAWLQRKPGTWAIAKRLRGLI